MSEKLMTALLEAAAAGKQIDSFASELGVPVSLFEEMIADYNAAAGEDAWNRLVAERRVQASIVSSDWDDIEQVALERLKSHVKAGRVNSVGDLLAIARTANQATRRNGLVRDDPARTPGFSFSARLGSGHMGVIELQLSPTIAEAASREGSIVDDVTYERVADPKVIRDMVDAEDEL